MKHIVAKNFINLGQRVFLEVLYLPQHPKSNADLFFCLSVGYLHGVNFSFLCPKFLLELRFLPIKSFTHYDYLHDCPKEKIS
jgi:hypothetical protein